MRVKPFDGTLKSSEGIFWSLWSRDWIYLTLLLLVSSFLIFKNLGNLYLILDEYDYAVLGKNILQFGFPTIWDGKNFIGPESHSAYHLWGQQVWLSFYLIAISYFYFGFTPLATRIPFALSGLITVFLLYALTFRITQSRRTARGASLLFALSVPCVIYMRTGRYMALTFLLSIVCIWFYLDLIESKKGSLWKFTISLIAYFHTFFPQMVGLVMGVVLHLFVCERRNRALRKNVFKSFCITVIFTFPWFALIGYPCQIKLVQTLSAMSGSTEYSINPGLLFRVKNVFAFLAQINTYIFPFALIVVVGVLYFFSKRSFDQRINRRYIFLIISIVFCSLVLMTGSAIPMQNYISGILPLLFVLLSLCFYYLYTSKHILTSVLLIVTLFSNIVHISLWYLGGSILTSLKTHATQLCKAPYFTRVENQINNSRKMRFLVADFLGEILTDFNGPQRAIVHHLLEYGSPNQTVLIAHEANAIIFFTNMKLVENIPSLYFPDWIIPRGEYPFRAHSFYLPEVSADHSQDDYVRSVIERDDLYRKIVLPVNDSGTENSYEIQCHRFSNDGDSNCRHVTLYQFVGE